MFRKSWSTRTPFFWTTGRTLNDDPSYEPDRSVAIGGAAYGEKFFPYVDKLLAVAPKNLTVKLVCDSLTFESNADAINHLKQKHGDRFGILNIDAMIQNLLKKFPEHAMKLSIVFQNAVAGNPVLASDIYRAIAMIYGQGDSPEDITSQQYTYCDVDFLSMV